MVRYAEEIERKKKKERKRVNENEEHPSISQDSPVSSETTATCAIFSKSSRYNALLAS